MNLLPLFNKDKDVAQFTLSFEEKSININTILPIDPVSKELKPLTTRFNDIDLARFEREHNSKLLDS